MNGNYNPEANQGYPAMQNQHSPIYGYEPPRRERTEYCRTDVIFAWISVLLGYIMMLSWSPDRYPVGMFLFTAICYGVTFFYIKKRDGILSGVRLVFPVSALVLNFGLLINSNETVLGLVTAYSFFAYVLWIYTAFNGEKDRSPVDQYMLPGLGKALVVLPFGSFFALFESGSQIKSRAGKKVGKTLLWIVLGLGIAVIPTLVIAILLSFDRGFSKILNGVFDLDISGVSRHIGCFILGIPVATYLFGLLYSASSGRFGRGIDREKCNKAASSARFAPTALVCAALTPIICLYGIFFFAQLEYFISGFANRLPGELTYAEYAREGFFQLCTVSFLNLLMLAASYLFCRRSESRVPTVLKIYCTVLSALTLVLISAALSKMIMYIDTYGLTVKRVLSSWFIILLAAVFICISLAVFIKKFNLTKALFSVFLILFSLLVFCNIDGLCHSYNADRCIDGTLDISAFETDEYEMGAVDDHWVIALDRIISEAPTTKNIAWAKDQLTAVANYMPHRDHSIFSMNVPKIRRQIILGKYK